MPRIFYDPDPGGSEASGQTVTAAKSDHASEKFSCCERANAKCCDTFVPSVWASSVNVDRPILNKGASSSSLQAPVFTFQEFSFQFLERSKSKCGWKRWR